MSGNVTIYLLFPPWCAQCVRLGPQLQAAIDRNQGDTNLKLYALLADKAPEPQKHASGKTVGHEIAGGKRTGRTPSVPADENLAPKAAAELLAGTPTFVVPPSTLEEFGATDFPFLIATDHNGVIRLLYPAAPNNALVEGGIVDQIAASILVVWPVKPMNRPPGAPSPH